MGGTYEAFMVLTENSIAEVLRFAYAVSHLAPAGAVVGVAAVLAGALGATALRRGPGPSSPTLGRPMAAPWVLGIAVAALLAGPAGQAGAAVLCRKGTSARLVVRDETCRAREHAVAPSELGLAPRESCLDRLDLAWVELDVLRSQLASARDLALRIDAQSWDDGATWLALEAARIVQTLDRLSDLVVGLGAREANVPLAQVRQVVTNDWGHAADACAVALALLPAIEGALPLLPPA